MLYSENNFEIMATTIWTIIDEVLYIFKDTCLLTNSRNFIRQIKSVKLNLYIKLGLDAMVRVKISKIDAT
jgi:hypothetical protein